MSRNWSRLSSPPPVARRQQSRRNIHLGLAALTPLLPDSRHSEASDQTEQLFYHPSSSWLFHTSSAHNSPAARPVAKASEQPCPKLQPAALRLRKTTQRTPLPPPHPGRP